MTGDRDPLVDLAADVADGAVVDWNSVHSTVSPQNEQSAISQLQIIAEIAQLHRRFLSGDPEGVIDGAPTADRQTADPDAPRWGPLVIMERLGSGSFGDVFRAWDTTLDREVALKLLRERSHSPSRSADLVAREGQLLARVHHANVMAIYGAQVIDGQVGIWGEFLRGRTLAQIITDNGPLSADEALVSADAIARALAAAHGAGLLHRDVKAQNVIREKGGRVVLMDFGLGRLVDRAEAAERGVELAGTPVYLAPELFAGGRASAASDLYSLGVLMFFLVTGTFPVNGSSLDEIRARHATGERQRLQDLRPDLPASFVHVVERALDPDPTRRFESAGAMLAAVRAVGPAVQFVPDVHVTSKRSAGSVLAIVTVSAAIGIAAVVTLSRAAQEKARTRPVVEFALFPPDGTHFSESSWNVPAISPDAGSVAFVATDDASGATQLYLRSFKTMDTTPVPASAHARAPFWSADSTAIAFFGEEGLTRVSIGGVRSDTIAAAAEPRGGTWNAEGTIIFAPDPHRGLFRVSATGAAAKPKLIIAPDLRRGELGYMWPTFLRDGRHFAFFVLSNDDNVRGIYLGALDSTRTTRIVASDTSGTVTDDRLLFVRDGKLAIQQFNTETGTPIGSPRIVANEVGATFDYRSVADAVGDTLVYSQAIRSELVWRDRSGRELSKVSVPAGRYRSPALSRDDRFLAVQQYRDTISRMLVFDLARNSTTGIIDRGNSTQPAFTPDVQFAVWGPENQIAYGSNDRGWLDIYVSRIGSAQPPSLIYYDESDKEPDDWSPDGNYLTFTQLHPGGTYQLWILPTKHTQAPFRIGNEHTNQGWGKFSPDGSKLAYYSTESGRGEVWIRDFPGDAAATQLSHGGGQDVVWLSSREVSYLDSVRRLVSARLPESREGSTNGERLQFTTKVFTPATSRNHYVWSGDRARVLLNEMPGGREASKIVAVVNWQNLIPD